MTTSAFPDNVDVKELFPEELAEVLAALGVPAYRAKQLFAGMHRRLATSFAAMTDLPAALRETLTARCRPGRCGWKQGWHPFSRPNHPSGCGNLGGIFF
ncbi:MAG: Dual-specificity RNA methyltransferase RlmN [bacterium ADurb.Bin429]|nr:MAG: Dual-specificity RNA methyltransferase RlmN [bacterium ADurb.Bin429]